MPAPSREWSTGEIATELPAAIKSGQLHLYYQPVVSLADRSTTRLEALPRWDHPVHGLLAPESFITAASSAGVLRELEGWAIDEALNQLARWTEGVPGSLSVALNFSLDHAAEPGIAALLSRMAEQAGAATRRLGLELSHDHLKESVEAVAPALREIADLGIDLTVDGYSDPSDRATLNRAPVSTVKIGRDVIAGVPDDRDRVALVTDVVSLGQELGLAVVATGIENPGQAAYLREAGCHFGQGFLFSVAMPPEVLEGRMSA